MLSQKQQSRFQILTMGESPQGKEARGKKKKKKRKGE